MEKAERTKLRRLTLYRLHGESEAMYTCIKPVKRSYSEYSALMQNIRSGWTFIACGTNMYEDGSIDWDFSKDGYFAEELTPCELVERWCEL